MRPTKVTRTTTGTTAWIPVDRAQNNFILGIMVDVSAGATLSWVVEMTMDDVQDPTVTPTAVTAPAPLEAGTGDEVGSINIPCTAVRLNATITGGTVTMTVVQGRK